MSDNIPFDIQMEVVKKVSDVKSLVQFRSVSKQWKSFIDSSQFIKGYGARHTEPGSRILMYKVDHLSSEHNYICLVDDDIETFKVQKQDFVGSPFFKHYRALHVLGESHGLLCLFCCPGKDNERTMMFVVWNPCIGKSFGIALPRSPHGLRWFAYGFGVCPVTSDPTVVKVLCEKFNMPWHAEVFTLSSGVWSVIPNSKLPRQSIELDESTVVVIDRFIYWGAFELTLDDDGTATSDYVIVSFDLITKEFKVVNLSDNPRNELGGLVVVGLAKLRESLVLYVDIEVEGAQYCSVWVMENNLSFSKLYTIDGSVDKILGFSKSGKPIIETQNDEREYSTHVYDPCSRHIKSLGISAVEGSFVMDSYKESLLLLDHSELHTYPYVN